MNKDVHKETIVDGMFGGLLLMPAEHVEEEPSNQGDDILREIVLPLNMPLMSAESVEEERSNLCNEIVLEVVLNFFTR